MIPYSYITYFRAIPFQSRGLYIDDVYFIMNNALGTEVPPLASSIRG